MKPKNHAKNSEFQWLKQKNKKSIIKIFAPGFGRIYSIHLNAK